MPNTRAHTAEFSFYIVDMWRGGANTYKSCSDLVFIKILVSFFIFFGSLVCLIIRNGLFRETFAAPGPWVVVWLQL